ncbi:MAG: peroxiredoxin [Pseudomonadales bacterium]
MKHLALVLTTMCIYLFALTAWSGELTVGDMAPEFSLKATDGKTYTLGDFHGKETVVLAWFPKAYTSGCTIECKSLTENGHLIRKFQASYFMISVDELEDNKGFATKTKADFPLLSDPSKETARAYGVLNQGGWANRHTFYIGANGKILAIDKDIKPATSAQDMAAKLADLATPKR